MPARRALDADNYADACRWAREQSDAGKAISKQGFHLFPKVKQIDKMLRAAPTLLNRVRETHPEGSFFAMEDRNLSHGKKTKLGVTERRDLLTARGFTPEFLDQKLLRKEAASDDLLDACAACWTAMRIATGQAKSFPETPGRDAHGLPIAIWV